jgi:hypothetical protein
LKSGEKYQTELLRFANLSLIIIGGRPLNRDIRKQVMEAGFECYMTKPMNVVEITGAIRKALEK